MRGAALRDAGKAGANLHPLDGVDAHHGKGDVGVQLVKQRIAQAHRHTRGRDANARAAGVAGLAQRVHVGLQLGHIGHRRKKRVVGHMVPGLKGNRDIADLRHAAAKGGAVFFKQPLFGHGAGRHHGRGQAGRRAAAAARVAQAVFVQIGVVGMTGPEGLQDVAVVLAALVGVFDQEADRRAGGLALVHAGQDFHRVGFVALRHMAAGAGAAAIQITLNVGLRERHAGRAAVNHAANGRTVGFTKIGDCEKGSKGIAAHRQ